MPAPHGLKQAILSADKLPMLIVFCGCFLAGITALLALALYAQIDPMARLTSL